MKHYNIENKEITVAICVSCGHQVDVTRIGNLKINGIDEMETTPLIMVDSLMRGALYPCCNNPDYGYAD